MGKNCVALKLFAMTPVDQILFSSNRANVNAGKDGFDLYKMNVDGNWSATIEHQYPL
jgi:hypothetical protein